MSISPIVWKKGRGKLGLFKPLMGSWRAEADSEMGPVICTRSYTWVLGGAYIQLTADWEYAGGGYQEISFIGVGPDKEIKFWSFTSDKKQSNGYLADVTDIHPLAFGFEAQMPAGMGRMAYYPDEKVGYHWIVEAKPKKNWKRIIEHHYKPIPA